jgi:hypothetical protein
MLTIDASVCGGGIKIVVLIAGNRELFCRKI